MSSTVALRRYVDPEVPTLTENGLRILQKRYLRRDNGRYLETPAQLYRRVADNVAAAEPETKRLEYAQRFYELMVSGRFLPNSPTLMNAGRAAHAVLSGCFVLPVPDDTAAIFRSVAEAAIIQKAAGGTGFAFDGLRPSGALVASSGGQSSGPLSFMRVFSEATSAIQQGAFRRGANMGVMRVDHPDILKFLFCKQDFQQFTNFNVSVKVSDEWLRCARERPQTPMAVHWGEDRWFLPRALVERCRAAVEAGRAGRGPARELDVCYGVSDLQREADGNTLTHGDVLDLIVRHAWASGEPGLLFIDRIRETETLPSVGRIESTNPCGEQPLLPNESCNLGSMNLGAYVRGPETVDWESLRADVVLAVRFLDNVVTVNWYPTEAIRDRCRDHRKIGLGVMGFADALLRLGVRYDSAAGVEWGEKFMSAVNAAAQDASAQLAEERGVFPQHERSTWTRPMRNACVTSIAPTGTLSILADCSGGIEPWFSFVFQRNVAESAMVEAQRDFLAALDAANLDDVEQRRIMDYMAEHGTLHGASGVPEGMPDIFRTARDVTPEWHVRIQAAFQRHTTAGVSKTINLAAEASLDDVRAAYFLANELGCKGITVYRDGCRERQPMARHEAKTAPAPLFREPALLKMPMAAWRSSYQSTYGSLHYTVTLERLPDGRWREREVFFNLKRSGHASHAESESVGRLTSMILRLDGRLELVIDQLRGLASWQEKRNLHTGANTSLSSEMSLALTEYLSQTAAYRNADGVLTGYPFPAASEDEPSEDQGARTRDFVRRVLRQSAMCGTPSVPCRTPDCAGEIVYTEGCHRCSLCGEGGCA